MIPFNLGDIVMVVGKIDTRVRDKAKDGIIVGTIDQFLIDQQVSVLLSDGEIWVGRLHEIVLFADQQ
jgi:hypothetical protein